MLEQKTIHHNHYPQLPYLGQNLQEGALYRAVQKVRFKCWIHANSRTFNPFTPECQLRLSITGMWNRSTMFVMKHILISVIYLFLLYSHLGFSQIGTHCIWYYSNTENIFTCMKERTAEQLRYNRNQSEGKEEMEQQKLWWERMGASQEL